MQSFQQSDLRLEHDYSNYLALINDLDLRHAEKKICNHECLTTPDFRAEICGPLEVPPYKQTDLMPHGVPASQRTSAICH